MPLSYTTSMRQIQTSPSSEPTQMIVLIQTTTYRIHLDGCCGVTSPTMLAQPATGKTSRREKGMLWLQYLDASFTWPVYSFLANVHPPLYGVYFGGGNTQGFTCSSRDRCLPRHWMHTSSTATLFVSYFIYGEQHNPDHIIYQPDSRP